MKIFVVDSYVKILSIISFTESVLKKGDYIIVLWNYNLLKFLLYLKLHERFNIIYEKKINYFHYEFLNHAVNNIVLYTNLKKRDINPNDLYFFTKYFNPYLLTFLRYYNYSNKYLFNTENFNIKRIKIKRFKTYIRIITFKIIYGLDFQLVESNKKLIEYLHHTTLHKYGVKENLLDVKCLYKTSKPTGKKIVFLNQPFFEKGRVDKDFYFNLLNRICSELQKHNFGFKVYFKEHPNTRKYFYTNKLVTRYPSYIPSEYFSFNKDDILITYSSTSVFYSTSKIISLIDILPQRDPSVIQKIKINLISNTKYDIFFPKTINELIKLFK